MGKKRLICFLALWSCGQTGQFVYFPLRLDQHCPPNTIDLRSRDRQPMVTALRSEQCHMSEGDSVEEFISTHALGRERLFVLSCDLPSHPLKILFLRPLGDDKEFLS